MEIARMLKEIQMLPTALDRIVNAARHAGFIGKTRSSRESDIKMQLITAGFVRFKTDTV